MNMKNMETTMDIGKVVKIGDRELPPLVIPPIKIEPQHEPEVTKPKKVKEPAK